MHRDYTTFRWISAYSNFINNLKYKTETASDYVAKGTTFKRVYRFNGKPYLIDPRSRRDGV